MRSLQAKDETTLRFEENMDAVTVLDLLDKERFAHGLFFSESGAGQAFGYLVIQEYEDPTPQAYETQLGACVNKYEQLKVSLLYKGLHANGLIRSFRGGRRAPPLRPAPGIMGTLDEGNRCRTLIKGVPETNTQVGFGWAGLETRREGNVWLDLDLKTMKYRLYVPYSEKLGHPEQTVDTGNFSLTLDSLPWSFFYGPWAVYVGRTCRTISAKAVSWFRRTAAGLAAPGSEPGK